VVPLLMGPVRVGTVVGAFSAAVIVRVDTESGPRVVSLLAGGAAGVPNGVRLTGPEVDLHRVRVGAPVAIGDGWVRVDPFEVRVVRSWSTRVMLIDPEPTSVAALEQAATSAQRGVPLPAINRLALALKPSARADRREEDLQRAVDGLVGLGRGLTPGGDDVLAGVLTGLHAIARTDLAAAIGTGAIGNEAIGNGALAPITERTTLLSADLLRLAAAGEACLEALAVLRAVHRPGLERSGQRPPAGHTVGPRPQAAIDRLLSIGHTSGADLATGLALGLGCDREAAVTTAGQGA
jgi:hypothetical protein